jgi:hypothetical protein
MRGSWAASSVLSGCMPSRREAAVLACSRPTREPGLSNPRTAAPVANVDDETKIAHYPARILPAAHDAGLVRVDHGLHSVA